MEQTQPRVDEKWIEIESGNRQMRKRWKSFSTREGVITSLSSDMDLDYMSYVQHDVPSWWMRCFRAYAAYCIIHEKFIKVWMEFHSFKSGFAATIKIVREEGSQFIKINLTWALKLTFWKATVTSWRFIREQNFALLLFQSSTTPSSFPRHSALV